MISDLGMLSHFYKRKKSDERYPKKREREKKGKIFLLHDCF